MRLRLSLILILVGIPISAWASFCPTNFKIVNDGDSINQVLALCGKPSQQVTKTVPIEPPQEWNYYIHMPVSTTTSQVTQGTMKVTFAFDGNGNAMNISVNGLGVGGTTICNGTYIEIGDSRKKVESACGSPSFVNKQTQEGQKSDEYTTLYYNTNPPKTLVFKNGLLQEPP